MDVGRNYRNIGKQEEYQHIHRQIGTTIKKPTEDWIIYQENKGPDRNNNKKTVNYGKQQKWHHTLERVYTRRRSNLLRNIKKRNVTGLDEISTDLEIDTLTHRFNTIYRIAIPLYG